jgi:hypothetical protein
LLNYGGNIVRPDGKGGLSPVNLAVLRNLIDKHVAAVRVVNRNGVWEREYYAYAFDPPRRLDPALAGRWPQQMQAQAQAKPSYEPDLGVLDTVYRHELVMWLPRVME